MKSSLGDKTQKNMRIFLIPKKYVTDLLTQKNTWHQNFQPKKIQDLNTSMLSDRNENPK